MTFMILVLGILSGYLVSGEEFFDVGMAIMMIAAWLAFHQTFLAPRNNY